MNNIKHIFKTIFRYKISSSLNIISLFITFWGIIILALFISHEFSYDNFHKNKETTYFLKINKEQTNFCTGIKQIIEKNTPQIENISTIRQYSGERVYEAGKTNKNSIICSSIKTDNDIFNILDFKFLEGNKQNALIDPNTVVITKSLAKKIFNDNSPIGKSIIIDDGKPNIIVGVIKDLPKNSSFNCDILQSIIWNKDDWNEWSYSILINFKKGTNLNDVKKLIYKQDKINNFLKRSEESSGYKSTVDFMPLNELHFNKRHELPGKNKININILYVLIILIILLAIMGTINFINFSTSQAPLRAKALAIKQIFGLNKFKTRFIIIAESISLALLALILSIIVHISFYTQIKNIFEIEGLNINDRPIFYLYFLLFTIIFGIIAGIYPAKYITSPKPADAIKGRMFFTNKGRFIRNTLIVLQLFITISLISISISIKKQIHFWNNFDTGLNTENVIYLKLTNNLIKHNETFAKELLSNNNIIDYTYTRFTPGNVLTSWGNKVNDKYINFHVWHVDERFIKFFNIDIIKGRSFRSKENDHKKFILNKEFINKYKWKDITGKTLNDFSEDHDIIGVCNNFNYNNLKEPIYPMVLWFNNDYMNYILLKTNKCNYKELFSFIKKTTSHFDNENSIKLNFLDTKLKKLYKQEEKTGTFIQFVALWTIILAITGLIGLIIFISRDRMREISIRKVNGASTKEIIKLLNNVYLRWLVIAFAIAVPVSYLCVKEWLSSYTYKTEISWWIFAFSGAVVLIITISSTSYINYKAASTNPIKNLKDE